MGVGKSYALIVDLFAKLLMILWVVWKNRNSTLWQNKPQTAQDLLLGSFAWLDDFQRVHSGNKKPTAPKKKVWKPAKQSRLTLTVDAAFLPNQHRGGIGGVLSDGRGRFKAAFVRPVPYTASPKQCELLAIREGLDLL
ncbi:uncharacterized protein LOC112203062 [Rosa chinensis]|uniref:uncharacterized protein LOC112203062 n=1 Tax=Rosa chinensis TaxID=74649 RepID=UPI000D086B05|nr:uncharacterized protein LOC112203062 [Rosa chinensis]